MRTRRGVYFEMVLEDALPLAPEGRWLPLFLTTIKRGAGKRVQCLILEAGGLSFSSGRVATRQCYAKTKESTHGEHDEPDWTDFFR